MRSSRAGVLVIGALLGCRGSRHVPGDAAPAPPASASAPVANAGPATRVTMRITDQPPRTVDGAALATVVTISKAKDTPERKKLEVYVFDAGATPTPTCASIASGANIFETRGSYLQLTVEKAVDGPGPFAVASRAWVIHTSETNSQVSSTQKGLTLTLQSYDGKSFAGALESGPGAANELSGSIVGTVCPPLTEQAVDQDGFPLPTDDMPAPPPPPPPDPAAAPRGKKPKGKSKQP